MIKDDKMCRITLDIDIDEKSPKMYISQEDSYGFLSENNLVQKKYIFTHITSRWKFKEWERDRWLEVFKYVNDMGYKILLSSGPDATELEYISFFEDKGLEIIFTNGRLNFNQNAFLIENASLFLGIDTAMMHVASTTGTPIIAIFGMSDEWAWRPWCEDHQLIMQECECKKKRKLTCDKTKILECMDRITSQ